MKLAHIAIVHAALAGELDHANFRTDPVFGLSVPTAVPDVPSEVLEPRGTWSDGAAYDAQAAKLAGMFRENFRKFESASEDVRNAGPKG